MEDITKKMGETITSEFAKSAIPPDKKYKILRKLQAEEDEKKEKYFIDYLKDSQDLADVIKLIRSKRLSKNQIRNKIKEYLTDPNDLREFLESILKHKTQKKEENKEATSAGGSAGMFVGPLTGSVEKTNTKKVPTVREGALKGGNVDNLELKKVETKEATSSSSSGQYSQPAIWAKSMSKKDWKGASTKYMPGAKRVQVKKKCKKFPYCNQGDIKALKIFESESVQSAIESVSSNYGYNKEFISEIVFNEIRKRQK